MDAIRKNTLSQETSPYLKQHAGHMIWWLPWAQSSLDLAARENKPIFLSVGYSTCHWCHVMAHESFEDIEVATFLNEHFVSIKVDREERPDIDSIAMDAVQALLGHGGWPISLFLLPDGRPFFGGTYFPRDRFLALLDGIQKAWRNRREDISKNASSLTEHLQRLSEPEAQKGSTFTRDEVLKKFFLYKKEAFDPHHGGFSPAPKFPDSTSLMALMRISRRTESPEQVADCDKMVKTTLDSMALGGFFDLVEGGFHRYSTDEEWLIPHFEKMLYDNAFLALTYLEAVQKFQDTRYAWVADKIFDYVLNSLTSPEGFFYAAEDADSPIPKEQMNRGLTGASHIRVGDKEEGYFHSFSYDELAQRLSPEELKFFESSFGVSPFGQFEGRNVLRSNRLEIPDKMASAMLKRASEIRRQNLRPDRDDKVIAAWNGWMLAAMARGYAVLGQSRLLNGARNCGEAIVQRLMHEGRLYRCYSQAHGGRIEGFAEDYAGVIFGLIELFQVDFDLRWLEAAEALQATMDQRFWDSKSQSYFSTDGLDPTVLIRQRSLYDSVQPSDSSLAAYNLLRLSDITSRPHYRLRAQSIFEGFGARLSHAPQALPMLVLALDYEQAERKQVVVPHKDRSPFAKALEEYLRLQFCPNQIVLRVREKDAESQLPLVIGKTTRSDLGYVCRDGSCGLPSENLDAFKKAIEQF